MVLSPNVVHQGDRYTGGLPLQARERLGARIRELAGKRINQTELVFRTGLGKGTIGDLWWGRANPTLGTLLLVARELNVRSIEELFGPIGTQTMLKDMMTHVNVE